jgi:pyruvate-ferredoxin/flavodoxin oxidoreductase
MDGNEAAARVAYALSEVVAIYPITPASAMGEHADAWSNDERPNHWGAVPRVVEMQSEAGAAGTLHGAATTGALTTTFTASQGLLLMLPNLFKVAGELTPTVIHVAARTVATHALSIFGDHSDVMAARTTGMALLCASSVQEAHDFAAVAHGASLRSRVPFLHFFDGFRTSHELGPVDLLDTDDLDAMLDDDALAAHRARGLSPDHPVLRGSAQNPDVFFQAREASNPFHRAVPDTVAELFAVLAERTGRRYGLVDYEGAPDADRVIVVMGSATGAVSEAVDALRARGEDVGVLTVRLYRPFPADALVAALPPSVTSVAVLDRTKEPGAVGEPLYTDVVAALAEARADGRLADVPRVIGGRYGLSSKEFTPAMAAAVFAELDAERPRNHFTVGIVDDVSHTSLRVDPTFDTDAADLRAVFYGLGSDGTVSANKTAAKLIGEDTDRHVQGYFVYDSKKSGSVTVSHLRVSDRPIRSTYLISRAGFVACHHTDLLERLDVLAVAEPGATVLVNAPWAPDEVWDHLPAEVQAEVVERDLRLWVVDAHQVARQAGLPGRVNAVMLPAFFALSGVLPLDRALAELKAGFAKAYGGRGGDVAARNDAAVDLALGALHEVPVPDAVTTTRHRRPPVPDHVPEFVARVTAVMLAGEGDRLPVSALPVDGTFPVGTARYEQRRLAHELPMWEPDLCVDCGRCVMVCPHAAIRMKAEPPEVFAATPGADALDTKPFRARGLDGHLLTIQIAPDDCTGCAVCVDVCPGHAKDDPAHRSLTMVDAETRRDLERPRWEAFLDLPELPRTALAHDTVKGAAVLRPLFEFSGACAGCGETPYLRLLTQLFGDRAMVANATGCSSIYGGNLPTTPWASDGEGHGPAWANSLFEDNAEFGLGLRVAVDAAADLARSELAALADDLDPELVERLLTADQHDETGIATQRAAVAELATRLDELQRTRAGSETARRARMLAGVAEHLVRRSVWIVGGDGWAYDIGSGGLDHVLASGADVNVLVLDTEVYSNTGGQSSKATPRGAVAKFATGGKPTAKKDLGLVAMSYGNVYVAQIAMGANDLQTVKALTEAEAWPGPSLVIAYSTCIAHGIDMSTSMTHQKDAVRSGYWPLFRYHPGAGEHEHPFRLDAHDPTIDLAEFTSTDGRFAGLARSDPERSRRLLALEGEDVAERWRLYHQLAEMERTAPGADAEDGGDREDGDDGDGSPVELPHR